MTWQWTQLPLTFIAPMADNNEPDYKALFLKAEEERREERNLRRQAEEEQTRERERNRQTTLEEFIRACHNLLSRPLGVAAPSHSTKGTIPSPTGKYCPTQLVHWTNCPAEQQEIYNAVINYVHPAGNAARLFSPIVELQSVCDAENSTSDYFKSFFYFQVDQI